VLDPKTWAERAPRRQASARKRGLRADEAALLRLLAPIRAARRTASLRRSSPRSSQSAAEDRP